MPLPPNKTEAQFALILERLIDICGDEYVYSSEDDLYPYADPFSPLIGNGQPLPSAAIAPKTVEETQAIVNLANEYDLPLWVVSTGKNFGYGGCEAIVPGSVIVDLRRMNQILEVDEDLAYAVVEPGVSQYDLWLHCQEKGLDIFVDGPSPAWSGVISNTVERGVGYGPLGERVAQICGMEVILPNGEIMRTGNWAVPNTNTGHVYKYGLGPWVDGLFTQSNLGIVTKMGIFLNPQPECFRSIAIDVPKYNQVVDLIDTLRPLRINGTVRTAASIVLKPPPGMGPGNFGGGGPGGPPAGPGGPPGMPGGPPGGGQPPLSMIYGMIDQNVGWRLRIGLSGHKRQVEADWLEVFETFKAAIPDCKIGSDYYEAPYDFDQMDTLAKLQATIPSMQETEIWEHGAVFISTVIRNSGEEFWKQVEVMREVYGKFDMPYIGSALHFHADRAIMGLMGVPIIPGDKEQNIKAVEHGKAIIEAAAEHGWAEYRTPTTFMQAASEVYSFNNHALRRFNEALKDTFDPNGVLAPGKNGIWPKGMRS